MKALKAFSITNYRGIGPVRQEVTDLEKISLFIGPNNAGKSAFLSFVSNQLNKFSGTKFRKKDIDFSPLDVYQGKHESDVRFQIGIPAEELSKALQEFLAVAGIQPPRANPYIANVRQWLCDSGWLWLDFGADHKFIDVANGHIKIKTTDRDVQQAAHLVWQGVRPGISGGDFLHSWAPELIAALPVKLVSLPTTAFIPAIRKIGTTGETYDDHSGKGLIDQLATIQNPAYTERHRGALFSAINDFLRSVTGDQTATLEIPHDRKTILVHMGERTLPLDALGTGIHEITMLAAFCTLLQDSIVCIEEPEIHLHPLLQRKLVQYLLKKTSNQYLIATHSAALIDTPGAAVFHVSLKDGQTVVTRATTPQQRHEICAELGYRASDIVQSNAIIWVEGPSDRIYLNAWIRAHSPKLIEGLHYSIMFYGGRLLNHLSADDTEVNDFIQLRTLNRHLAIIIDSDKDGPNKRLNETKKRIVGEFNKGPGIAWVTAGREIENYVPTSDIERALQALYKERFDSMTGTDRYDHLLHFHQRQKRGRKNDTPIAIADKVKMAKFITLNPMSLDVLDLNEKISRLIAMIHHANQ